MQVLIAIVARCCLHTMYEFTAFMNMWAVESLGVSGGMAAQVSSAWQSCMLTASTLLIWCIAIQLSAESQYSFLLRVRCGS